MKRRARELLDTIRDAVKAHLSHPVSVSSITEPQPQPIEVEHANESVADLETRATQPSTLWSGCQYLQTPTRSHYLIPVIHSYDFIECSVQVIALRDCPPHTVCPVVILEYRNFAERAVRKESSCEGSRYNSVL